MNSTVPDESLQNAMAATIMFMIAATGLTLNLLTIFLVTRIPTLRNSFGALLASHCSAAAGILAIFTFWAAPITLLGAREVSANPGHYVGVVIQFFWYASIFSSHGLAANRLIAIAFPFAYEHRFTKRGTIGVLVLIWSAAGLEMIWYISGCDIYFDPSSYGWTGSPNSCKTAYDAYENAWLNPAFIVCLIIVDSCTFIRIRHYERTLKKTTMRNHDDEKRFRQDVRFFVQAMLSDLSLVLCHVCFAFIAPAVTGKWPNFIASTVAWESHHLLDALIIILYNEETRAVLFHPTQLCVRDGKHAKSSIMRTHATVFPTSTALSRQTSSNSRRFPSDRMI